MTLELTFLVQGSQEAPYTVKFRRTENNLTVTCTCAAGAMGQICKHRFGLLKGETAGLVSGNAEELRKLPEFFIGSDVEAAMERLVLAEEGLESAKTEVAKRKKELARLLND